MTFMRMDIILNLLGDMALIALVAYLIGRSNFIASYVNQSMNVKHWLALTLLFSLLSIMGTYNGIAVGGALASTRLIGTLMSGIMGGPVVGFSVGLISGVHRYLIGGFTAGSCGFASVLGGLFAGIVRQKIGLNNMTWKTAGVIALVAEIMQKVVTLLFSKPFEAAWALEKVIAIPTILVSVIGTIAFMFIIKDIQSQQEAHGAKAAEMALRIASLTLPYLRQGLNIRSATETANIIYDLTKAYAVSITDTEKVLAYIGKGSDHHLTGEPILTQSTKQTILKGTLSVIHTHKDRGCPVPGCPLSAGVVAPLIAYGAVVGTIKLSRTQTIKVNEIDIQLARGIAQLLSVQIELAEIDAQKKMREKAELKALRAQINPHFLFNTLSIIMSFCRTNPETARNLLEHLSVIMKYSFAKHGDFITLGEELEKVKSYLEIAKSRFGSRLTVTLDVDTAVLNIPIPVLAIQPLVENAVQHGLFPKLAEGHLVIKAYRKDDVLQISIFDNGVGIEPAKLHHLLTADTEGIGLQNVYYRLKRIYGDQYGLTLDSEPHKGTWATIRIPCTKERNSYEN